MKKILLLMIAMVFTLAVGAVYASEALYNGVTDFTGRSYDTLELAPIAATNNVESSSAGGLRAAGATRELYNGVTDFTGRSYDTFEIAR